MRVFVLGSTGMLGAYVSSYLTSVGFGVVNITRESLDASKAEFEDLDRLNPVKGDVFINCMGVIKQRGDTKDHVFIKVNSAFPHMVADYCEERHLRFIHVTTDCVFSGKIGQYNETNRHDATDIYGKSKSFGEPKNATVIRTSIIGEEKNNKASLLEWVKSNKNGKVNGFTNHVWNGITCLQFAKLCKAIMDSDGYWKGVVHICSPKEINKADLVKLISDVFELNVEVTPVEAGYCDRSLSSIYPVEHRIPPLTKQLIELRLFGLDK